ncbi:MAG: SGNH/GDSL hydrolase family protein [Burkholderiales bacterium]
MRITKFLAVSALTVLLAACGSGGDSTPQFGSVISFGDSLSDAGAYKVGSIAQVGGGKFTTNPGTVWIENVAQLYGLTITPNKVGGFGVAPATCPKPSCTAYGQGGSRVTSQPGIGNSDSSQGLNSGTQTIPMKTQIADHLAQNGGKFKADDLVFVWGGNNDIFVWLDLTGKTLPNGLTVTPTIAQGQVQQAATELVTLIADQILAKGAQYVAVLNLPDSSKTPFGNFGLDANGRTYLSGLVDAFNATMNAEIKKKNLNVLIIDSNTAAKDQVANPTKYGFAAATAGLPACDTAKILNITGGFVTNGSSLFCSANTLAAAGADTSYAFADSVHPTTLGHKVISDFVKGELEKKGWL